MSRTRDIATILSKTDAANADNHALLNTSSGVDSAEVITLITANSSNLDSADMQTISSQVSGNRNLVINGAMNVAQRGTSLTGQGATSIFLLDRFRMNTNGASAGRYTITQTADGPSGFANCLKLECTTADTSIAAGERLFLEHPFEGQNLQKIAKGTSDAQSLTVSFYVKGNAAATYVAGLYDNDNNRQVSKQFAVTSSWNRITLTFPADTTGALGDDNALSMQLRFYLHAGSNYTSGTISETWIAADGTKTVGSGTTSFFDSTSRTFFITGVQLETGDVATPFEHEDYVITLNKCLRYFYRLRKTNAWGEFCTIRTYSADDGTGIIYFPQPMRAQPTLTIDKTVNSTNFAYDLNSISVAASDVNVTQIGIAAASSSGSAFVTGGGATIQTNGGSGAIDCSFDFAAEL